MELARTVRIAEGHERVLSARQRDHVNQQGLHLQLPRQVS